MNEKDFLIFINKIEVDICYLADGYYIDCVPKIINELKEKILPLISKGELSD